MPSFPEPQIVRSRRASIAIHIEKDGSVIVKAPLLVPNFVIKKFIQEKSDWIEKTRAKLTKRKPAQKTYQEGEAFLFLGKEHTFTPANTTQIVLKNEKLYFPKAALFRAQKELTSWYMQQAKDIITKRLEFHAKKMHVEYKHLLFSDTKSKWGTCFPDNSLQFNWRLVMTPLMVLDYVVIHELTHITEKNHGDAFWRRVRLFTPAYKQHRKWIEENAHLLMV